MSEHIDTIIIIFITVPIALSCLYVIAKQYSFYRYRRKTRAYVKSLSDSKKRHRETSTSIEEL